eukprot:8152788-Heterocapsa_arctica.AAC.1
MPLRSPPVSGHPSQAHLSACVPLGPKRGMPRQPGCGNGGIGEEYWQKRHLVPAACGAEHGMPAALA